MNWDAIGAIGEILGAVAVVLTLFYLAKQTKQSVELGKTTEQRTLIDQSNAYLRVTIEPENLAAIRKGLVSYRELQPDEQAKAFVILVQFINHYERCLYAHKAGVLPTPVLIAYRNFAISFLVTPGGAEFWLDIGENFGQDVQDSINGILNSDDLPGPITESFAWLREDGT